MKKISMIFLSLVVIFIITGCGAIGKKEKKLVCTTTQDEEGMNIEQVMSMTYKNDKLKYMTMEVNAKIKDSSIQDNWEEYKKMLDSESKTFDKEGISLKVNVNDKNYEYKVILDIDVEKVSEEDLEEQGLSGLKDDTNSLEENKKSAEEDGATCVVK